jgi:predicted enzyme related to lactoylglutathione lyase
MSNVISWFEIPAKNFKRACSFYEQVLEGSIQIMETPGTDIQMGFLPGNDPGSVGGAVVEGEGYSPSQVGSLVYLNGGDDLSIPLARVEKAGGEVIVPKSSIGENGFIAQFIDTEGNRIAFHSMK